MANSEKNNLGDYKQYAELLKFNPNLILYGPPGTGKTYATQKIIEAFETDRTDNSVGFEQVEKEGRVKFITFHQSYSYEEFIEGICPQLEDDAQSDSSEVLRYRVKDGILKNIAESVATQLLKSESDVKGIDLIKMTSRIWKVSLGLRDHHEVYARCKKMCRIAVEWLENVNLSNMTTKKDIYNRLRVKPSRYGKNPSNIASSLDSLVNQMNKGDIVLILDSDKTIRDIGVVTSDYEYISGEKFPHTRTVDWLKEFGDEPFDVYEMNGRNKLGVKAVHELPRISMSDILQLIHTDDKHSTQTVEKADPKPYYLIIDEINRGNISKIFGELITLIEKDKRETLRVTLPYSNKPFTLPKNLYIIGTMNTADRSIAMLDTALRRRFVFVEVEPDYTVLKKLSVDGVSKVSVDLANLLQSINRKIIQKLDRDHRIGHAYFMDISELNDLYKTWYYKILPLLMEYFYNDLSSIKSVVGEKFFDDFGSMKLLDTKAMDRDVSEFEEALQLICKEKSE